MFIWQFYAKSNSKSHNKISNVGYTLNLQESFFW